MTTMNKTPAAHMDVIFPYVYLQKTTYNDYELSVIVDTSYCFKISENLQSSSIRALFYEQWDGPPCNSVEPYYRISDANGDTIEFSTFPKGGDQIKDVRTTSLVASDLGLLWKQRFDSKRHLPHVYLVKHTKISPEKPYKLYIAIHHARNRSYQIMSQDLNDKNIREIEIKEIESPTTSAGIWHEETCYFAQGGAKENISIIVKEMQFGRVKGEGTVRHSSADIKPFDLGIL